MNSNSIESGLKVLDEFLNSSELSDKSLSEKDNLIERGLSSIQIMQLSGKLRKVGLKVPFSALMTSPTLGGWKQAIEKAKPLKKKRKEKNTESTENTASAQPFNLTDVQYACWSSCLPNQ